MRVLLIILWILVPILIFRFFVKTAITINGKQYGPIKDWFSRTYGISFSAKMKKKKKD